MAAYIVVIQPAVLTRQFLYLTVPFKVGDRVEARTGGQLYDGVGTVMEVWFDHRCTPSEPFFRVEINEPANKDAPKSAWYTKDGLIKVAGALKDHNAELVIEHSDAPSEL